MAVGVPGTVFPTPPASATDPLAAPLITAASLAPLIVKLTVVVVPSSEVIVKLSILLSFAPKYCTLLLATE